MSTEIVKHSDIALEWIPHPLSGNVAPKQNIDSIRQAVRNLLMMSPYDIPFSPNETADIKRVLFDNFTAITKSGLTKRIDWVLKTYEKRIETISIKVEPLASDDGLDITIVYRIKILDVIDTLFQHFQRVR